MTKNMTYIYEMDIFIKKPFLTRNFIVTNYFSINFHI
jgi:hypothetical protein